jgi:hypothetical protein
MACRSLAKAFGVTNEGGCLPDYLLSLPEACSPRPVAGEDFRSSATGRVRLRRISVGRDHKASGEIVDAAIKLRE